MGRLRLALSAALLALMLVALVEPDSADPVALKPVARSADTPVDAPVESSVGFVPGIPEPDLSRCPSGRVALTFDDGPDPRRTAKLLNILRKHEVHATFFVIGSRLKKHPEIVAQAFADGHAIENHSWSHPVLSERSAAEIEHQISKTETAITNLTGLRPVLFRPPFGVRSDRVVKTAHKHSESIAKWTIDPQDWRTGRTGKGITSTVMKQLRQHKTNVVLLHDGVANSHKTLIAVEQIITQARKQGFCFVRMDQTGAQSRVEITDALITRPATGSATIVLDLALDTPAKRNVSLTLLGESGDARAGQGFSTKPVQVIIPAGSSSATAQLVVSAQTSTREIESFTLRVEHLRGVVAEDLPREIALRKAEQ